MKATPIVENFMIKWTINGEPKLQQNGVFIQFDLKWNLQMWPPGNIYLVRS